MPQYGVSTVKRVSFRGVQQEFGNTYLYQTNIPSTDTAALNDLIDKIVIEEKPLHSADVTFVAARLWTSGGTKEQNQMIIDRTLSGVGTNGNAGAVTDRERAMLVQFRAGVDTRGRPVRLKKWIHVCAGGMSSEVFSNGVYQNTAQLGGVAQARIIQYGNAIKSITPAGGTVCTLVAESGRPIDGPTTAHPYLEHHQLGDMWRAV
jgi:hypothetical protein